jgi:NAD(P)-dependent dehydrogenase (short-subunit alcohol dehydrogenase family)
MPLALISGASTGIGRATALRLASSGWTVLAGVRDPASDSTAAGDGLIPVRLDITDAAHIADVAQRVREGVAEAGHPTSVGLDALVNNAGIGIGGPLELIPAEDLRRQFEVNVLAQIALTQAVLPSLRLARGRIVFVSSIGGRVAAAFTAPYAASKHAIEAIGDALRVELAGSNVQVALVEPGSVATPIWEKSRAEAERLSIPPELEGPYGHVPAAMAKTLEQTARRGIPAEEVAQVIEQALTSRRMKARYLVGRDARAMLIAKRLLPDLLFDRVIRRALGV